MSVVQVGRSYRLEERLESLIRRKNISCTLTVLLYAFINMTYNWPYAFLPELRFVRLAKRL